MKTKFNHQFSLSSSGPSFCRYRADGITAGLDFFEHILRVSIVRNGTRLLPTWSVCPDGNMPLSGRDRLSAEGFTPVNPERKETVTENGKVLQFTIDDVSFSVELTNFRISAETKTGVLYRDRSGLAYNFDGELGRGAVHYTDRFPGQQIFGLGDKSGPVNKSGRRYVIGATDSMGYSAETSDPLYKQIPFYICRNAAGSYGIFYDTYSNGVMDFGVEHDNYFEPFNKASFEEENLVFYLILGTPKEIIRRFNALCGQAAPVPKWAFHYTGSTMEYTDAPDADARLRGFVKQCEENGMKAGGFWMSSGYTQIGDRRYTFHWNREKIPSPEDLSAYFREHGMELITNVKPAFLTDHPLYDTMAEQGLFLHYKDGTPACFPFWGGMASYLDFTNEKAYEFWKSCIKENHAQMGFSHIWNDNNEYDVTDESVLADFFGNPVPACRIRPLFSYLMARASREACIEAGEELPFNVSRCGIAGTQRVASTWTGDNFTSFPELRWNHRQIMTMALSGFLFFGPDIGGFAGPKPEKELFLRWLQYGIFMPRFTLHSWKPGEDSTMPWLYPDLMPKVRRLFDLREMLVPYLAEETERCRETGAPLLTPVFLCDPEYDTESDCFFCGSRYFVCPVFDEGAESVTVTLPEFGETYKLRDEGKSYHPGEKLTIPCALSDLPVYFTVE